MYNLCRSSDVIALMVRCYCADQAFFNKYTPIVPLHCVAVLQGQQFSTACRLARCNVYKKKHLLKESIKLGEVRLHCILLPDNLVFLRQAYHLILQPVVVKNPVEEPVISLLKLFRISWILEEIPALLVATMVVF